MADDETEEFFIQLAKNFQKPSSDKPVLQATFEQSEHLLRALLQQAGKDPNELNEDHISPVWCACYVGSTKCLEILLEHNANPDIPDRVQQPPLFVAVYQGSEDNVKLLLQSNASLYSRDSLQRTALHAAADAGNASIIKLLIEHDNSLRTQSNTDSPPAPLVSWEDHQGRTALHYAAANNQCECVDSLINGGANVDQADHKHYTPLHVASEIGHDYVVDILIDETANMEALDSLGRTPLHIACTEGKSYCVDLLIANGAEISTFDGNGLTALHLAVLNDQVEIVKLLLDGAEVETVDEDGNDTIFRNAASPNLLDQQQRSAMHAAAELGNVVLCELLLQRGTELNSSDKLGRYPIHYCGLWSPAACVDWFLVKGVPVDETDSLGRTCLHYACYFGNYQVAHALLRRGANANLADNNGDTPLLCSLHEFDNNDKTEIGQLLLEFGANPLQLNLKKRSPIHICSCTGDTETLELLLDSSDSDNHRDRYTEVVNLQDVYGVSCMPLAAADAQCDNLEFLIQRGGNPNAKDSTGATILMWAVRGGSVDCVDMMLHQFHAAVDTVDHAGRSLLHVASIANSFECVRPLLEVNCSPMLEDAHGRNALHYGAHYGSLDVLKLFNPNTCTGLDWNKTDKVGQNPLHRSVSRNHLDLSKFLIDRGTNVNQADQNGVTPLMLAAFHNSSACVDLLLANSADPSLVDARGRTYKAYIETGKKFRDGQYSTPGTKPIPIPSQPAPEPPAKEPEPVIPEPIKVEVPVVAEPEKEPPVTPEPVKVEVPEHKPENPPEELVEKPPVVPVVPVEVKPEVKLEPVKEPEPVKVPEVVNNPPEEIEKPKEIPENVKKPEKQPEVVKPPVVNNSNNPESVRSLDLVGEEAQAPVVKEIRTPKQKPERLAVKRVNEPVSKPNQPFVEIPVSAVPQPVEPRDPQILPHENPNPDYQAVATAPAQQPFYMYPYLWLSAILSFLLRVLFRSN